MLHAERDDAGAESIRDRCADHGLQYINVNDFQYIGPNVPYISLGRLLGRLHGHRDPPERLPGSRVRRLR